PLAINTTITAKKADLTDTEEKRWSHLDLFNDTIPGMSVDRAYSTLLQGRKATKIIVGVVDSGVDIEHPDLQGVIWTNPKEIAGNGIDDDNNGYIDDIHGWNFLGDINHENMEFIRILKKGDDGSETYKRAKAKYDEEYNQALAGKMQMDFILKADKKFQELTGKENYTAEDLKALDLKDPSLTSVRSQFVMILAQISREELAKEVKSCVEHKSK